MKAKIQNLIKNYPFSILCFLFGTLAFLFVLNQENLTYLFNKIIFSINKIYLSPHALNFSLGEAIAALGLIFAVIQLLDKRRELSLRIQSDINRSLWWFFSILGLLSVLFASYLSRTVNSNSILLSSLLWEQLGFVFFIASPASLWLIANRPSRLFNSRNAERFYNYLLRTASTGKAEDIEIVVSLILINLDRLTVAIRKIESYSFDRPVPESLKYCLYAQDLLNVVLSDRQVADYIVTTRIDFLFYFLHLIKENRLSRRTLYTGFDKIVKQLFENTESYLYKQLEYDGLSMYAPIYKTIFGDLFFINEFNVLKKWNFGIRKKANNEEYAQVFVKALEEALQASKFSDHGACEEIAFVLHQLVDFSRNVIWDPKNKKGELNQGLWQIEYFFGHIFPEEYKKALEAGTVNEYELQMKKGDKYRQSLTASYSLALVEFLGEVSRGDDREMERHRAMGATEEIFSIIDTGNVFDNLRECILENMWDQIEDNVKRGFFPATLRIFIELIYWKNERLPNWYIEERNKLIKYLYDELAPRIIKNELMVNFKDTKEKELLPPNISFDRSGGKFIVTFADQVKEELK